MPLCTYVPKRFNASSQEIIDHANEILEEYAEQGFTLTLRQLYYQFVARDLLTNNQKSYKRLGSIVNDARLAGLVDWGYLIDRTRGLESLSHWKSPAEIISACANQFRYDLWADQRKRIEVWIEKDALVGVIEGVCRKWDVPYLSCRGYTSQSEMWGAAERLKQWVNGGQDVVVLHLGDHDPSGIDMSRDIIDRLRLFGLRRLNFERLALNMDQVEQYSPPPNFAKQTDARYQQYVEEFDAEECWELDALEPSVIADLIEESILHHVDGARFNEALERQEAARNELSRVAVRWESVVKFANRKK